MKSLRSTWVCFMLACFAAASPAFAIIDNCGFQDPDYDHWLLIEYINSKRSMPYMEKEEWLEIGGDVRSEWQHRNEKLNTRILRGGPSSIPRDTFDVQLNLKLAYEIEHAWAKIHLQFEEEYGVETPPGTMCRGPEGVPVNGDPQGPFGGGFCDDICLKRCYAGYKLYHEGKKNLYIEIGRRPLYTMFDSRIEFHARFDGIYSKYSDVIGKTEYYISGGPFVVDNRVDHFAGVGEIGAINFLNTRFDLKYSYIDWVLKGINRCEVENPRGWNFRNSQWSFAYNFKEKVFHGKARLYGAFLVNHVARKPIIIPDQDDPLNRNAFKVINKRYGIGWYAGFILYEANYQGDWSLDVNYQYVEPQAIPDPDVHGIGRGNALKETFTAYGRSKANYKGFHIEALYMLTDDIYFDVTYDNARACISTVGGPASYSKIELDVILEF